MLRATLAMLFFAASFFGQTPKDSGRSAGKSPETSQATAYYHFMLARLYADEALSFSLSHKAEYTELARKELKAALKADPHAPGIELPEVRRRSKGLFGFARRRDSKCRCIPWEPSNAGIGLRRSNR